MNISLQIGGKFVLLVTSAEMQKLDTVMIEEIGVASAALMESVGLRVAEVTMDMVDGTGAHQSMGERVSSRSREMDSRKMIAVVVGKGHNGADGLVAARYLHVLGYSVRVWLTSDERDLSHLTHIQLCAYRNVHGRLAEETDDLTQADVIIDAILGNGSQLPVREPLRPFLQAIHKAHRPVLSIDFPTGLDPDSGQVDVDCVKAVRTVACGLSKPGLYVEPGRAYAGQITIASLAISYHMAVRHGAHHFLVTEQDIAKRYRRRPQDSHKGSFGRVGVLAGSPGMYGAARLAVEGAYRAGAGLVYYFAPEDLSDTWVSGFPVEAVVKRYAGRAGVWNVDAIASLLALFAQVDVGVIGPGMGRSMQDSPEALLALAQLPIPLVLDADFLQVVAASEDGGVTFFEHRKHLTIITPHPKEFAQLIKRPTSVVQENRLLYAKEYAVKTQTIVVLKGAGTVIATPEPAVWINSTGNSGLATGGTGDVLAGLLGGLLASGYGAESAALVGVYVHGKAAELACTTQYSQESLVASDLFAWFGTAFRQISWEMDISHDG
nr:NAD(P)H-hydrate dehydratase [Sulfoacidibacillus ferrooxidans]